MESPLRKSRTVMEHPNQDWMISVLKKKDDVLIAVGMGVISPETGKMILSGGLPSFKRSPL
jgi:hypothetical protein